MSKGMVFVMFFPQGHGIHMHLITTSPVRRQSEKPSICVYQCFHGDPKQPTRGPCNPLFFRTHCSRSDLYCYSVFTVLCPPITLSQIFIEHHGETVVTGNLLRLIQSIETVGVPIHLPDRSLFVSVGVVGLWVFCVSPFMPQCNFAALHHSGGCRIVFLSYLRLTNLPLLCFYCTIDFIAGISLLSQ